MLVCKICRFPPPRSSVDESLLYKERFVYLFEGSLILTHSSGYGIGTDRSSLEFGYYCLEYLVVNCIKSSLVYIEGIKSIACDGKIYMSVSITCAKSLTRRRRELAIRGVPLLRSAISYAASCSIPILSMAALLFTILTRVMVS